MDGKKIRELRMKKGISLTELARLSGVSKSYLSFIERGKQTNPGIEVIAKISEALNIDVQSLLSSQTQTQRKQNQANEIDKDVIQLALEMSNSNIDKEKLRQLIALLK